MPRAAQAEITRFKENRSEHPQQTVEYGWWESLLISAG